MECAKAIDFSGIFRPFRAKNAYANIKFNYYRKGWRCAEGAGAPARRSAAMPVWSLDRGRPRPPEAPPCGGRAHTLAPPWAENVGMAAQAGEGARDPDSRPA